MGHITAGSIDVDRRYTVSDMEPVRDSAGCPLDPTAAVVRFRARRGRELAVVGVEVEGNRMRGLKTKGTHNRGYYTVQVDGTVEPHYRYGDAPDWVQDVVNRALADHAVGVGLAPAAVTA